MSTAGLAITPFRPQYLPPGWSAYTHPEGQRYFARDSCPRVVTEADLYSREVQDCVAHWIKAFEWHCTERLIPISDDAELFLEPDAELQSCRYYLVDYPNRVVFWLEEDAPDALDLPATVTATHLRLVLEAHNWTHVEYFSMHRCQDVDLSLDKLKTILLHARVDQLTSATSTFPYGAKECSEFLEVVKTAQGVSGHHGMGPFLIDVQSVCWTVTSWRRSLAYGILSVRIFASRLNPTSSRMLQSIIDSRSTTASNTPACRETSRS